MIPRRFFWLLDLGVLLAAFFLTYAVWPDLYRIFQVDWLKQLLSPLHPSFPTEPLPALRQMLWVLAIVGPATIFFLGAFDAYGRLLEQSLTRIILSSFSAPLFSSALAAFVAFTFQRSDMSRLFIFAFMLFTATGLAVLRLALRSYIRRRWHAGVYAKPVLLAGSTDAVTTLLAHFAESVSPQEYYIAGYVTDSGAPVGASEVKSMGGIEDLGNLLISEPIQEVIAVQTEGAAQWMKRVIEDCDSLGVLLRIVPNALLFGKTHTLRMLYPFQILSLPAVVLAPPHFDSDAIFFKRVFDILVSAILLILLLPVFVLIAIAIKVTDRNSEIFYRWRVVGRNGIRFTGYKFTTMYSDADERRKELLSQNEMTGPVFKIKNDPRVTPVGRFLRKFSLNELPQLWSVLKGDMSLVGPRPAFPHELERYDFWHKRKLSIRPGITCLWQVRGRNKISNFDDWVKMDLEYIDNWSLWLDFKILVRTAWAVVAGTGS